MRFQFLYALPELGLGSLARYAVYQFALRSGWLRYRTPAFEWAERPLGWWLSRDIPSDPDGYGRYREGQSPRFFFKDIERLGDSLRNLLGENAGRVVEEAESVLQGRYRLFGQSGITLGSPPDWGTFAFTASGDDESAVDPELHWTEYDLNTLAHDVKLLWEISRFGWVYPLVRAYALTGDERYVDGFSALLSSWRAANIPNEGLNWHSGQEIAIRLLALVFSFYAFGSVLRKRGDALGELAAMIAVHAGRIPSTLAYARAQNNNHLLVEALALYSVGVLFPEFKDAKTWKRNGKQYIVHALKGQVLRDGGYIQYSMNYHRLALQAGIWALRLADLQDDPFPRATMDALRRMNDWLQALVDPATGKAPNWGPNDGALIFPLSSCLFGDFRPTLQTAARTVSSSALFARGPWDEMALWFGFDEPGPDGLGGVGGPSSERGRAPYGQPEDFEVSGIYLMRGQETRGMMRAAKFHSRPGHSDQLHFDLWLGDTNLARDPGTYLYNAGPPWTNVFSGAWCHNTVFIDGMDPMLPASKFLWLRWSQAELMGHWWSADGALEILSAQHRYRSHDQAIHQRTILRLEDRLWMVVDDILGTGEADVRLGWTLPDLPFESAEGVLRLSQEGSSLHIRHEGIRDRTALYRAGVLVAGEEMIADPSTYGWHSPTYALKEPALHWLRSAHRRLPMRGLTTWMLSEINMDEVDIGWSEPEVNYPAFSRVEYRGRRLDI